MVVRRTLLLAALLVASASTTALSGLPNSGPAMGFHPKVRPPATGTTFSAVVKANGTLVRGVGATAAMQADAGAFEVDFTSDVSQCAFVATIGQTGSNSYQPSGLITVVGRSGVPQGVYVATTTRTGNAKFLPFHLDVGC